MKRKILLAAAACCIALGGYLLYLVWLAGELRTIEPHFDGECRFVPNVPGAEDIVILQDGSGAFISSQDRFADLAGEPARGAIYHVDLRTEGAAPRNLLPDAPPDFRPHGIALWEQDGRTSLFVVNHPGGKLNGDIDGHAGPAHTIEVYDWEGGALRHRRTVSDPALLVTPNDVAPVGHDQFYVSNDHGSGAPLARQLESYLRLTRAHLLFFDGAAFRRLPGEYRYANGVIASPDGTKVFLAAVTAKAIYVFDRDSATNDLTLRRELPVDTGPDNLNLDEAGNIWVGAHPKLLTAAAYIKGRVGTSPTQVLRIDGRTFEVTEVMMADGAELSASTVAARHGRRLLVGSLDARGYLDCAMAAPE